MKLTRRQWWMLAVLCIGSFITVLNQTIVTPALPSIMIEMKVDAATVQWLTTGFTLVNAIMIPITAYMQDHFRTRGLFLVSMLMFAAGTILAALSTTFASLLIGRLVQAAGAGILMPMTMTVLMLTFPIERRGSAMGLFGLVVAFAPAIGPTVAGFVIDRADWHLMFYGVAFLSLAIAAVATFLIPSAKPEGNGDSHLDALSLTLSTLGFGLLLYGFSAFSSPVTFLWSLGAMGLGLVGVIWFFFRQLHLEHPMLRVDVLKNRRFLISTIISMLAQGALMSAGILMPIYVQTLMGQPAIVSGLVLMPGAILTAITNPIAGSLFDKHGPRKLSVIGMGFLAITTALFATLTFETSMIFITVVYAIRMVAMALVNMPITTWGMNALDNDLMNHGTSVNNTLRQVAGSLGTAIIISVSSITQSLATPTMGEAEATLFGINLAFGVSALLCLIGAVMAIVFVKDRTSEAIHFDKAVEGILSTGFEASDPILRQIMRTDVYMVKNTDTVADAMKLFVDKHISAAPIVNEDQEVVGFISDGDILRLLSPRGSSFVDPILMTMSSVNDARSYNERLADLMGASVRMIGVSRTICVDVDDGISEVCRVLANNHLKKVPVLENSRIVGIIDRSDITQYSMEAYLKGHSKDAVFCEPDKTPESEPR